LALENAGASAGLRIILNMTIAATLQGDSSIPQASESALCFHCGDVCPDNLILIQEKNFCCEGCKTVYEILNANDLCQYYRIEKNAGISLKGRKSEQYAWLDDPDAAAHLIDFTDGAMTKTTLYLPQIHCASCIWLIENLHRLATGVLSVKLDFLKKEAYVTFSKESITLRKIVELLASIGYAPEINLGTLDRPKRQAVGKRLIYQLGVAGFSFGNIMLLSFPEYFGLDETETWFKQLFGFLNILLATPVAFYSGKDYLTSAWFSLKTRNPGIDVPLALGIIVLYFRSAYEIVSGTGAGYIDSLAGLVFFLLIGKWFQQITFHRISFERDYKSYFPVAATKLHPSDHREECILVSKLEAGDTILVRNQELIPADGILKKGKASIDYSFVTGESEPVVKIAGDKIFAGGRHLGDAIEVLLTRKVSQSYLTQLWNENTFQEDKLSGTSRLANRISRYFTVIILTIAFGTLAYWLPRDAQVAFNAFTAVLIIACPCAAALNVPFTLGNAVRILAKRGFYLKNTNVLEELQNIKATVFDKTGTLTHALDNQLIYEGEHLAEEEAAAVAAVSRQSGHPLSRQVLEHLLKNLPAGSSPAVNDYREFIGKGIEGTAAGKTVLLGSLSFFHEKSVIREGSSSQNSVLLAIDGKLKGGFRFQNRYRESSWEVLDWFQRNGSTFLLSGDNEQEREFLAPKFKAGGVFFNQTPQDKLDFIKNMQAKGTTVLMLGDGLNDAGALKQSDVGIVVAENTNNFTPACDAILEAKQFRCLPGFLNFGKNSLRVVYWAWVLAAIYNVVGLSYATQGALSPVVAAILMPLSSISIVAFGVGAGSFLAKKTLPKQLAE
jgi:Cu+-exporting ATPase